MRPSLQIKGRKGKQCRERWQNQLDPTVKKGPWSEEEDEILIAAQKKHGNKWDMKNLEIYLHSIWGIERTRALWLDIEQIIVSSLKAVQHTIINDKHCYECYGYDIIIDDTLKPWLVEVNASPSLTADTPQDYELKFGLLDDVYTLVDVEAKLGGAVEECVGGFDLIWNNGPVKQEKQSWKHTNL